MNRIPLLFRVACLAAIIVAATAGQSARAQQFTGKVSGTVVERGTNQSLPGVNVFIEGTQLGASTDAEGRYTILRVPPGIYRVVFSFVGFQTVQVEEVEVRVDRTTTVNAEMGEETFEGDEVVIVAERPAVERDRTSTSTDYNAEEIEAAPVEGMRGLLELTAGVNRTADGNFSIRGGGSYEVSFLVNGVEQVMSNSGIPGYSFSGEKANNSWKFDFNPLGVQQMEVISGGFSAEYGNAQSGVVKLVTKEGGEAFEGEYRVEYRSPGKYHFGPYLYGDDTSEWQRWGAIDDWAREFPDSSQAWRERMHALWVSNHAPAFVPSDTVYNARGDVLYLPGQTVDNKLGVYDYRDLAYVRHMFGLGGPLGRSSDKFRFHLSGELRAKPTRIPTVEQVQDYRNVTLTTTFQPTPRHKFKLTNVYQYYRGGIASGADDIRWAGREARWKYALTTDSPREEITLSQNLGWTYAINAASFLEATVAHSYERYDVPVLPVTTRTDPWSIPPGVWDEDFRTVFSFTTLYQQDARTNFFDASLNYTWQVTPMWQFKTGLQGKRWNTHYSAVSSFAVNAFITRTGYGEFYTASPTYGAAYLQNKLEFEGMVANLGLRLDGYNYNMDVPADRFNPFYPALGAEAVGNPATEPSKTRLMLSPRLGISFPIGEDMAFRLQYGHFSSMPQFRHALMRSTELGWRGYGNANLKPEKTVSYEVGLQQALGSAHRLDLVGYYNDRVSQVGLIAITAPTGAIRNQKRYTSFENNTYGASYGVETTVERMDRSPLKYRLSYTLSRTTQGSFGPTVLYSADPDDPRNYQQRNPAADAISVQDRTHRIRAFLTYRLDEGEGPELLGIHPLSSTTLGLIYSAQSGSPYTYVTTFQDLQQFSNNRRYPFEEQFDLSINKALTVRDYDLTLGVRIENLFNHRVLTPLGQTPTQAWVERNITVDDPAYATLQSNFYDYFRAYRNVPRQIFFNLGFRFK